MKTKFNEYIKLLENISENAFDFTKEEFRNNISADENYLETYLEKSKNIGKEISKLFEFDYISKAEFINTINNYDTYENEEILSLLDICFKKLGASSTKKLARTLLYDKYDDINASLIIKLHRKFGKLLYDMLRDFCHTYWTEKHDKNQALYTKCSEYVAYLLRKNNLIDDRLLAMSFNDLFFINGKLALILENWGDLEPVCYDSRNIDVSKMFKVVMNGEPYFEGSDYEFDNIDEIWEHIELEYQWNVVDKMVGVEFTSNGEIENEIFKKEKVIEKNKDLYYKSTNEDGDIVEESITSIITSCKRDEFEEIWDALQSVYNYAQESANNDELYEKCKKAIIALLGEWEIVRIKESDKKDEGERILFYNPDLSFFEQYDEKYGIYDDEEFGANLLKSMGDLMEGRDRLDVDTNNIYGSITSDHVTDELLYKLDDITVQEN